MLVFALFSAVFDALVAVAFLGAAFAFVAVFFGAPAFFGAAALVVFAFVAVFDSNVSRSLDDWSSRVSIPSQQAFWRASQLLVLQLPFSVTSQYQKSLILRVSHHNIEKDPFE